MLGTKNYPNIADKINYMIDHALTALQCKRAMGATSRNYVKWSYGAETWTSMKGKRRSLAKEIRQRRRALVLADQFPVVSLDETVTRLVRSATGAHIALPLVFSRKLPTKRNYSFERNGYRFSTTVPSPPPEAMKAIQEHGQKFDWLEVWWVPNEVLVEKLPDPDPILVGAVSHTYDKSAMYYFELHRWIDNSVENGYWSKEGY